MLQKLSTQKENAFYLFVAVGAVSLALIALSFARGPVTGAFSSLQSHSAAGNAKFGPASRVAIAETGRWTSQAGELVNLHGSTAWVAAGSPARERADAARWNASTAAKVNLHGSTAIVRGGLLPADRLAAARMSGIAGESVNLYGSTAWVRGGLSPAARVEAQRLTGLAGTFVNLYGTTSR